jgi:exopolysaccharide biosynthesis protein
VLDGAAFGGNFRVFGGHRLGAVLSEGAVYKMHDAARAFHAGAGAVAEDQAADGAVEVGEIEADADELCVDDRLLAARPL